MQGGIYLVRRKRNKGFKQRGTSEEIQGKPALRVVKTPFIRRPAVRVVLWSLVLLLLTGGVLYYINMDYLRPDRIEEWVDNLFVNYGRGSGYPVPVAGSAVADMAFMGDDIMLLTNTSYYLYNDSAYEILGRQHGYAEPVVTVHDTRSLMYNMGGTAYRIENRKRILHEGKTEAKIITADMSPNGNTVLVTEGSGGYAAVMTTLNSQFEQTAFQWSSTSRVLAVAASPDGTGAAATVFSAEGGHLRSGIAILDFKSDTPVYIWMEDSLFFAVRYAGDRIVAIGDNRCISVKTDGSDLQEYSYGNLAAWDVDTSGNVAIAVSAYRDRRDCTAVLFNKKLEVQFEEALVGQVNDLSANKGRVVLLTTNQVIVFRSSGEHMREIEITAGAKRVVLKNDTLYVLEASRLQKHELT